MSSTFYDFIAVITKWVGGYSIFSSRIKGDEGGEKRRVEMGGPGKR